MHDPQKKNHTGVRMQLTAYFIAATKYTGSVRRWRLSKMFRVKNSLVLPCHKTADTKKEKHM